MKKAILFIAFVSFLFLLSGCQNQNEAKMKSTEISSESNALIKNTILPDNTSSFDLDESSKVKAVIEKETMINLSEEEIIAFKQSHIPTGKTTEDGKGLFFQNQQGLIGIMDFHGNVLAEAKWKEISSAALNGFMMALNNNHEYEIIDSCGNVQCLLAGIFDNANLDQPIDPEEAYYIDVDGTYINAYGLSETDTLFEETSNITEEYYPNIEKFLDFEFTPAVMDHYWKDGQYGLIQKDGKYGVVDQTGKIIVYPEWDFLDLECNHYWKCKKGEYYGILDEAGNTLEEPVWDSLSFSTFGTSSIPPFSSQRKWIAKGVKLNEFGLQRTYFFTVGGEKIQMPLGTELISSFQYGYAVFKDENKGRGLIREDGKIIIEPTQQSIMNFFTSQGGFALVNQQQFFDGNGNIIWETDDSRDKISCQQTFSNGYTAWGVNEYYGAKLLLFDQNLNLVDSNVWNKLIWDDRKQCFYAETGKQTGGWYNKDMSPVDESISYELAIDITYPDGFSRFVRNSLYGFINAQNQVVIQPTWEYASCFIDGIALVGMKKGNDSSYLFGYIDTKGNYISDLQWDYAYDFKDGMGVVFKGSIRDGKPDKGKYGILRSDGHMIMEPQMEEVYLPSEGICRFRNGDTYGYIRNDGFIISPLTWKFAKDFEKGYGHVSMDSNTNRNTVDITAIDRNGLVMFDPVHTTMKEYRIVIYPDLHLAAVRIWVPNNQFGDRGYNLIDLRTKQVFKESMEFTIVNENHNDPDYNAASIVAVAWDSSEPRVLSIIDINLDTVLTFKDYSLKFLRNNQYFLITGKNTWYLYDSRGRII